VRLAVHAAEAHQCTVSAIFAGEENAGGTRLFRLASGRDKGDLR
jgi:hypothetical protein